MDTVLISSTAGLLVSVLILVVMAHDECGITLREVGFKVGMGAWLFVFAIFFWYCGIATRIIYVGIAAAIVLLGGAEILLRHRYEKPPGPPPFSGSGGGYA